MSRTGCAIGTLHSVFRCQVAELEDLLYPSFIGSLDIDGLRQKWLPPRLLGTFVYVSVSDLMRKLLGC
ncbi:unnamed protein product [Prunus armeniaca]|uniref:Uncharacterized protein n=1 Tax=Prunus armeniaca TaxID=36596 RepID=A0A6J5VWT6_PRUAR|nr:unnamed protein product [Prunus armeniaca]